MNSFITFHSSSHSNQLLTFLISLQVQDQAPFSALTRMRNVRGEGEHPWSRPRETQPARPREEFPLTDWTLEKHPGNLRFPSTQWNYLKKKNPLFSSQAAEQPSPRWPGTGTAASYQKHHSLPITKNMTGCTCLATIVQLFRSVREAAMVKNKTHKCVIITLRL